MEDKIAEYRASKYDPELVQRAADYAQYIMDRGNVALVKPMIITVADSQHKYAPPPKAKWANWLRQGPMVGAVYVWKDRDYGQCLSILTEHFTEDYPRFAAHDRCSDKLRFITNLNSSAPYTVASFMSAERYAALDDETRAHFHKFGPSILLHPMWSQIDVSCLVPYTVTYTDGGSVPFWMYRTDPDWADALIHIQLEVLKVGDTLFA